MVRDYLVRDPIKVAVGIVLLTIVALIVVLRRVDAVTEGARDNGVEVGDAGPAVVIEPIAAIEVLSKLEAKPVTTKKGRILKEALKKKLDPNAPSSSSRVAAVLLDPVALSGDAWLRRAFSSRLKVARIANESEVARGWLLSLRMDTGETGGVFFAKCSAAMSELPGRKLAASLSARADVGGDGIDEAELRTTAKDTCAAELVDDVSKWLKARR